MIVYVRIYMNTRWQALLALWAEVGTSTMWFIGPVTEREIASYNNKAFRRNL